MLHLIGLALRKLFEQRNSPLVPVLPPIVLPDDPKRLGAIRMIAKELFEGEEDAISREEKRLDDEKKLKRDDRQSKHTEKRDFHLYQVDMTYHIV